MSDVTRALEKVREAHRAHLAARRADDAAHRRRDQAIRHAHALGASYQQIADVLKVTRAYVYQICREE